MPFSNLEPTRFLPASRTMSHCTDQEPSSSRKNTSVELSPPPQCEVPRSSDVVEVVDQRDHNQKISLISCLEVFCASPLAVVLVEVSVVLTDRSKTEEMTNAL